MNTSDYIDQLIEDKEEFRDKIATVDEKGKRIWIHPKKPGGRFHTYRIVVTVILLSILFVTPFIYIEGHPLFLFNIFERKFIFFGKVFMPQDFHLVALGMITFFVFIILFTVAFGRLWCGWACPQTLFMEMVFRKIEYWIEGDANQQRKLNQRPWDSDKIFKKTLKQVIFIGIALLISHTMMAYLIGLDKVIEVVSQPPAAHFSGFIGLMFFTFLFYFVFAYFREQACIVVCPYGRLQSVLLGKDSVAISYDFVRGEPRAKIRKNKSGYETQLKAGDCIDCSLCVQVCPTGIDIRNGTQLECVNCTACIDACDAVMDKISKPRGLVRFASYNNILNRTTFKYTPRLMGYTTVLVILLSVLGFLLVERAEMETTILRIPGSLYQELPNGSFTNAYNVQVANKTFEDKKVTFKLKAKDGIIKIAGGTFLAQKNMTSEGAIVIELPKKVLQPLRTKIEIEVWSENQLIETISTNFLGPG